MPPTVRATIVAFYLLTLNLVGVGIGITAAGIAVDAMIAAGSTEPYTIVLLVFTVISFSCIPLFYLAGRRYDRDRAKLYESVESSSSAA